MINQGAQALIVAPLNSDGLEPALQAARGQEDPGAHHRPQGQLRALQGLRGLPRLELRRAGQARRRGDDQGDRRQGQGRDPARLVRQQRDHRPHQGLRRRDGRASRRTSRSSPSRPASSPATRASRSWSSSSRPSPDITGVYAENDEMALGALVALKSAGKTPGKTSRSSRSTAPATPCRRSSTARCTRSSSPTRASARSPSRRCEKFLQRRGRSPQNVVISDKLYAQGQRRRPRSRTPY